MRSLAENPERFGRDQASQSFAHEIVLRFQKVFQHAEDVASVKRDLHTGKLAQPSERKFVRLSAADDPPSALAGQRAVGRFLNW